MYYCDCRNSKGEVDIYRAKHGQLAMKPTKADKEGYCVHCGHIALETDEQQGLFTYKSMKCFSVDHQKELRRKCSNGNSPIFFKEDVHLTKVQGAHKATISTL